MGVRRLDSFPTADPRVHMIVNSGACVHLARMCPGAESFACPHCDELILRDVNPRQVQGFCFQCDKCDGHSIFPDEHDQYPHSESRSPPPEPLAAGSRVDPAEVRTEITNAIAWLHSIGVNAELGRVGAYLRAMPAGGEMDDVAFAESREILEIYSGLHDTAHTDYFRDRFKRMTDGPISMVDENAGASSNGARNFAFELVVAARLAGCGIELDTTLGADVAVRFDRRRIALQCKRPMSLEKVETALRKARAQLNQNYKDAGASTIGLIVLDLTKVGGFDRSPATGPYEEIYERHMAYMQDVAQRRNQLLTELCGGTSTVGLLMRVQQLFVDGSSRMHAANWYWKVFDWVSARDFQTVHALALRFRDYSIEQHAARETNMVFDAKHEGDLSK